MRKDEYCMPSKTAVYFLVRNTNSFCIFLQITCIISTIIVLSQFNTGMGMTLNKKAGYLVEMAQNILKRKKKIANFDQKKLEFLLF